MMQGMCDSVSTLALEPLRVHNYDGMVKKIMEYMTNIDERIQCTEGLVFSGLGQTSPMVLAGPDRARQVQIVPRQFWTHLCMFCNVFFFAEPIFRHGFGIDLMKS